VPVIAALGGKRLLVCSRRMPRKCNKRNSRIKYKEVLTAYENPTKSKEIG